MEKTIEQFQHANMPAAVWAGYRLIDTGAKVSVTNEENNHQLRELPLTTTETLWTLYTTLGRIECSITKTTDHSSYSGMVSKGHQTNLLGVTNYLNSSTGHLNSNEN